jgi:hypothetical protein
MRTRRARRVRRIPTTRMATITRTDAKGNALPTWLAGERFIRLH